MILLLHGENLRQQLAPRKDQTNISNLANFEDINQCEQYIYSTDNLELRNGVKRQCHLAIKSLLVWKTMS